MKKIICFLLCITLCISLCGCIKIVVDNGEESTEASDSSLSSNKDDSTKNDDKPDSDSGTSLENELWDKIGGVWLNRDIDGTYFSEFGKDAEGYYLTQGIPASGYSFGGRVTSIDMQNGNYQFTVRIPAAAANEENEGHDEYTLDYFCEIQSGSAILLTNHASDGSFTEWEFSCDSWDAFDWDAFFNENNGVSLETAWNDLNGVWTAKDSDGTTWFDIFGFENGQAYFSSGIPYSGYGIGGKVTGFEDRTYDSTWWVNLHFDAVPANEESSGSPAYDVLIMVDYSDLNSKKIDVTNIAGDGKVITFEYRCETLDQLPLD